MTATVAQAIRLELDMLPPTVNHMYRSTGGGRRALTDEALTFRGLVAIELRGQSIPSDCSLVLSFWFTFPNKRRSDGDNRLKALQDSIALALGFDDTRIVEWHGYTDIGRTPRTLAILETRP